MLWDWQVWKTKNIKDHNFENETIHSVLELSDVPEENISKFYYELRRRIILQIWIV